MTISDTLSAKSFFITMVISFCPLALLDTLPSRQSGQQMHQK